MFENQIGNDDVGASTQAFYDRESATYDVQRWNTIGGSRVDELQQEIVGNILDWSGRRVLEVGHGSGRFTELVSSKGGDLVALDLSAAMSRYAHNRLSVIDVPQNPQFVTGSAFELPFKDDVFDACVSINVFSHLPYPDTSIGEIARVLRSGAILVINFPNLFSYFGPMGALVNIRGLAVKREVYTHWYSYRHIMHLMAVHGFNIEEVIGHVHIPPSLDKAGIRSLLLNLDRVSRHGKLRLLSPILFVKAVKK